MSFHRVRILVEAPQHAGLDAGLDYLSEQPLATGTLVRVPLGRRTVPGIVWAAADRPPPVDVELKPIADVLDAIAPLPTAWRQLVSFAAGYYQRSAGELALAVLPPELRRIDSAQLRRRAARGNP